MLWNNPTVCKDRLSVVHKHSFSQTLVFYTNEYECMDPTSVLGFILNHCCVSLICHLPLHSPSTCRASFIFLDKINLCDIRDAYSKPLETICRSLAIVQKMTQHQYVVYILHFYPFFSQFGTSTAVFATANAHSVLHRSMVENCLSKQCSFSLLLSLLQFHYLCLYTLGEQKGDFANVFH